MKSAPSSAPWLRLTLISILALIGFAVLWIVLLGPAVLVLITPR